MFIEFDNIINARDLGGTPVSGGRAVKRGVLLRTAELSAASDGDLALLGEKYSVRRIFDFRDPAETVSKPDRPVAGAEYRSLPALPLMKPGESHKKYASLGEEGVLEVFCGIYRSLAESDESAAAFGAFFRSLLSGGGEPVLWHCTQGKDRTGIAAMLLLSALGASEEDAELDYFLTNVAMQREFDALERSGEHADELGFFRGILFVYPQCVGVWRGCIRRDFGSADGYLRERLGLGGGDLAELRKLYTE